MSLNRYRGELPFGDDELREIRGRVMKQIEKERERPRWLGVFARASLAAALLVLWLLPTTRREPPPPAQKPVARRTLPVQPRPSDIARPTRNTPPPTPPQQATAHRPRRRPQPRPAPEPASAESISAPVRIELQTSNPDIRILWITQPTGETR